jgi:hypothetical protein
VGAPGGTRRGNVGLIAKYPQCAINGRLATSRSPCGVYPVTRVAFHSRRGLARRRLAKRRALTLAGTEGRIRACRGPHRTVGSINKYPQHVHSRRLAASHSLFSCVVRDRRGYPPIVTFRGVFANVTTRSSIGIRLQRLTSRVRNRASERPERPSVLLEVPEPTASCLAQTRRRRSRVREARRLRLLVQR